MGNKCIIVKDETQMEISTGRRTVRGLQWSPHRQEPGDCKSRDSNTALEGQRSPGPMG